MYLKNRAKYGKPMKIIHAGEYYVTSENEMIGTLLGSCIAVCLWDSKHMVGGMNHFMLPGRISKVDIFKDRSARYGITAMNELLDNMIRQGADRKDITAKMFGGGSVLEYANRTNSIPDDNIRIAKVMLELADIQIMQLDVGGKYSRKVLFDNLTGKAYIRKTTNSKTIEKIVTQEINDLQRRNLMP
jgi:chemotaxis protein CheD